MSVLDTGLRRYDTSPVVYSNTKAFSGIATVTLPVSKKRRSLLRWAGVLFSLLLLLLGTGFALDALFPLDMSRSVPSVVVTAANETPLHVFTTKDGMWRLATTPDKVDPVYLKILQAYEDKRFFDHPGVDPFALVRAVGQRLTAGRVVSGASTLTMQVARLLEPRPRTIRSKIIEIGRSLQLEARYSKQEILSLYLTLAPFGANIEGVRSASMIWLGREPSWMTPGEAALLVAIPQSPAALRPDRHPEAARAARDKVLDRMLELGVLSAEEVQEAKTENIPTQRHPPPRLAPHISQRLLAEKRGTDSLIDFTLQNSVEALLRRRAGQIQDLDPESSISVLVVDNLERSVIAYAGSVDSFDIRRQGAVDMVRAIRSPGSTWKPFIYGMAFDDRTLHPGTIIRDVRTDFAGYAPSNFNPQHMGAVSVRESLQMSLNIPAVIALNMVTPTRFAARLRDVGSPISLPRGSSPSLPIALGGAGTTLEHLVLLYAGLARGGEVLPLRLRASDPQGPGKVLFGAEAAAQITSILAEAPPPPGFPLAGPDSRRIAFKTGTSYGYRDAWAIGYDARYTVGVWVGRPDGTPIADRLGRNAAAPVLYETFALLPRATEPLVPDQTLSTAKAPQSLRRLGGVTAPTPGKPPLEMTFPPDNSVIELSSVELGLKLTAKGGRRPLVWLVNGEPLQTPAWRQDAVWLPDGPGAATITVIDTDGRTVSANVWLQ